MSSILAKNILPRRDTKQVDEETWDYLILYDKDTGEPIVSSSGHSDSVPIVLKWNKLEFTAEPTGKISVSWNSLMEFVNEKIKD